MTNNQANLGGPFVIAPQDGKPYGKGAEVTNRTTARARGSVVQFASPTLAGADAAVEANAVDSLTGGFANVTDVANGASTGDDSCLGVVTDKDAVAVGEECSVVTEGDVWVRCYFETGVAVGEFVPLYMVDGEDYLTANASLGGATVGRKCALCLESVAADSRASNGVALVRVLFRGLPTYL